MCLQGIHRFHKQRRQPEKVQLTDSPEKSAVIGLLEIDGTHPNGCSGTSNSHIYHIIYIDNSWSYPLSKLRVT